LNALFEKFEATAAAAEIEQRPACRVFARRQLHPLLLCAPFLHRTYRKPLGYAGDYEMVNMISRDPHEGTSLFAKLVNHWFLAQPTPEAHRNRLKLLENRITEVAVRVAEERRPTRILSLGCGPAIEIQEFVRKQPWADRVEFTLIDFNQETLDHTGASLNRIKRQHGRSTVVELSRKSVMAILRETQGADHEQRTSYDFVYCAGLFDYLTAPVCRRLSTCMFNWLRPGGLFLTTNVHDSNPWALVMDYIADWHLVHRSSAEMLATRPEQLGAEDCRLTTDSTGVNVFLEATKPQF
jgi:extracellular factor (EF) 3-hydroxypalmitic acid methyl ester biosynthesis protein